MNIKETRFNGLIDEIDFYSWVYYDKGFLSKEQKKRCSEIKNILYVFGSRAKKWINLCNELIK